MTTRGFATPLHALVALAVGCASSREPLRSPEPHASSSDDPPMHFHDPDPFTSDETHRDAGSREYVIASHADAAAVAADASAIGAELVYLVAHIGDHPDPLRADESANVRQLAARGDDGLHAIDDGIIRRGDVERLPFARRVIDIALRRKCNRLGRNAEQRVVTWIDLGTLVDDPDPIARPLEWSRHAEDPWPDEVQTRFRAWLVADTPCVPDELAARWRDGGSPSPTVAVTDAAVTDR